MGIKILSKINAKNISHIRNMLPGFFIKGIIEAIYNCVAHATKFFTRNVY